jgi:site-specific DNA-methyltransferase (adenine-specific)
MKPNYERGGVKLWNADALEWLPTLEAGSIGAVLTDPPFGVRRPSARRSVAERFAEIEGNDAVDARWAEPAFRALSDGGCCYSFCTWDTLEEWRAGLAAAGFRVRSCIVWDKGIHGLADLETCWAPRHEFILFGAKGRHVLQGSRPVDIVRCMRVPAKELEHPYQKPVDLLCELLETNQGTVCDPHMGSGTAAVACVHRQRPFVGCELSPEHFDTACRRVDAAFDSTAMFDPEPPALRQAAMF